VLAPALAVAGATAVFYSVVLPHRHARAVAVAPPVGAVAPASPAPVLETPPPAAEANPAAPVAAATTSAPPAPRAAIARADATPHDGAVDVRRQVAWIDHARSLADSGDPSGALQALDGYDRAFPHGVLSEESALLRIEALAARGDHRGATALAKRFLVEHPRSVHAAKVRSLLDGAD
jgi:hypothetical protein